MERDGTTRIASGRRELKSGPRKAVLGARGQVHAGVAQLVRASAFQAEGREFESRLPLHEFG